MDIVPLNRLALFLRSKGLAKSIEVVLLAWDSKFIQHEVILTVEASPAMGKDHSESNTADGQPPEYRDYQPIILSSCRPSLRSRFTALLLAFQGCDRSDHFRRDFCLGFAAYIGGGAYAKSIVVTRKV